MGEKKKKASQAAWSADSDGVILIWKAETRTKKIQLNTIQSMCATPSKDGFNVWVSTKSLGVCIYEAQNYSEIKRCPKLGEGAQNIFFVGNNIWISGEKGLIWMCEIETFTVIREFTDFGAGNQNIIEVKTDELDKGQIWIGDNNGCIYILHGQSKELIKRVEVDNIAITSLLALPKESQVWSIGPEDKIKRWFFVSN